MKWQPIRTAPKDGTHVLVLHEGFAIEAWMGDTGIHKDRRWQSAYRWFPKTDGPTHWMKLPAVPGDG